MSQVTVPYRRLYGYMGCRVRGISVQEQIRDINQKVKCYYLQIEEERKANNSTADETWRSTNLTLDAV